MFRATRFPSAFCPHDRNPLRARATTADDLAASLPRCSDAMACGMACRSLPRRSTVMAMRFDATFSLGAIP